MKNKTILNRRNFLKFGIGAVGTLTAVDTMAQMCIGKDTTADQPLGPFFPRPNSPVDPIIENTDPTLPLHLANDNDLTYVIGRSGTASGQIVYVNGKVTDSNCRPIAGATIVIWQASESGRYNHKGDAANPDFIHPKTGQVIQRKHDPSFQYWGRTLTDSDGNYQFKTIVPGFYPADLQNAWYRPPHIHFMVSATGYPQLVTQMYFRGEKIIDNEWTQELNQLDFLLQSPSLSMSQKEKLIVDFKEDHRGSFKDGLVGNFDITLER